MLPRAAPSIAATSSATVGTVKVNYTGTNVSKISTTTAIYCTLTVVFYDVSNSYTTPTATYRSPATITAGAVTCSVTAPYSVNANPSTTTMATALSVAPLVAATTANALVAQTISPGTVSLPANGATTVFNVTGGRL